MDNQNAVTETTKTQEPETVQKTVIIPEGWGQDQFMNIQKQLKDPNRQRGLVFENEKQRNAMAIRKGLTKPGKISYDTLRRIALSVYVARICINSLKAKVTKTKWVIQPIDQLKRKSGQADKRIKEVTDFFKHPNTNDETFRTMLDKMTEDLLVLDAVSLEKTRYPDGKLAELHFVDSATIRPVYDEHGNQDIEIPLNTTDGQQELPVSYVQVMNNSQYGGPESGDIVAAWPKKDFLHFHMNPQGSLESFGYGLSPLEGVMSVVSNLLNSDNFNSTYFEEGAFPPVILNIVGSVNQRDMEAFKEYFYQELSGNFHRPALLASQQKSEVINLKDFTNRDMQFMEYTMWLAKMLCAAYEMSPEDIGITDTTGSKSVSEVQKDISQAKGYGSILGLYKEIFNQEILWKDFGYEDLEFEWAGTDITDPKEAADIQDIKLKNGTLTINEARLKDGETAYGEWADKPMVLTSEGYKPMLAKSDDGEGDDSGEHKDADEKKKIIGGEKPYNEQDTDDVDGKEVTKSMGNLYLCRYVENAQDIIAWAKGQGFLTTLEPADMHVTLAYSQKAVEWDQLPTQPNTVVVNAGTRNLKRLGDKGAVVLTFESDILRNRWAEIIRSGGSWDFDDFMPHITISYKGEGLDLSAMAIYDGPIVLGPEQRNPIDENWQEGVKEKTKKSIFTGNGYKTWADDRGTAQPFIYMDIKTGTGLVIKPPVAVNLQSQQLEIDLTAELAGMGLNVRPIKKWTYVEVRRQLQSNPEVLAEFDKYCEMDPFYDSEKWRAKYGGSRKFAYYLVTEYIDGYTLSNPLLIADMKRDPGSYAQAARDLAHLWQTERDQLLGDRRADQYIIDAQKRTWGIDYQFKGDRDRWNRTQAAVPDALTAVPELKVIFDAEIKAGQIKAKSLLKNLMNKITGKSV